MKGISISLYNKWDELGVLIDLIRENWDDEYFISVCSGHENAEEEIEKRSLDVDEVLNEEIRYKPDMASSRGKIKKHARILNSFRKSSKACFDANCDYVIHLHADAWPLSEGKLLAAIDEMDDRDCGIAVRGHGFTWRTPYSPSGQIMDQFFIMEKSFVESREFLDFHPLDLLPHKSIHNSLALLVFGRAGRNNTYFYADMSEDLQWDKSPVNLPFTGVRPGIFNQEYRYLHIATDEFPESYGRGLQAKYLEEHSITGDFVGDFKEKYGIEDVVEKIYSVEKRYNRELRILAYDVEGFGREFDKMNRVLNQPLHKKVARGLLNHISNLKNFLVFNSLPLIDGRFEYLGDKKNRRFYRDSKWNEDSGKLYLESLEDEDFEEDSLWFRKTD